jgi:hypothetical protein
VRRLDGRQDDDLRPLLAVLPLYLPLLTHLTLCSRSGEPPEFLFPQLAHPCVRRIELHLFGRRLWEKQMCVLNQTWVHSARLSKLEHISCSEF